MKVSDTVAKIALTARLRKKGGKEVFINKMKFTK